MTKAQQTKCYWSDESFKIHKNMQVVKPDGTTVQYWPKNTDDDEKESQH